MKSFLIFIFLIFTICNVHAKDSITFVFDPFPPFHEKVNGKSEGIFVDIIEELFENRLGYNVVYKQLPWKRAQIEVQEGIADCMITNPLENRLEYSYASDIPVLSIGVYVYTYKGHPRLEEIKGIKKLDDLKKKKLTALSIIGYDWFEQKIAPNLNKVVYVPDDPTAIEMLAKKRADIIVAGEWTTNLLVKKMSLEPFIEKTDVLLDQWQMHLLYSKKKCTPEFLEIINKNLNSMQNDGSIENIVNSYKN